MSFIVCSRGRKSLPSEATYTFSQPFGSLTCSPVKALTNHGGGSSTFLLVFALQLSTGWWFTGENSDASRWLIPTPALSQLSVHKNSFFFSLLVIILSIYTHWSLSFPS